MGEGVVIDGDDPAHIKWIHDKALARAEEYGIQGVTYRLTQGLTSITPLLPSTSLQLLHHHFPALPPSLRQAW